MISLPFAAGAFDLVVAFEVIEHLADWQSLLEEANACHGPRRTVHRLDAE